MSKSTLYKIIFAIFMILAGIVGSIRLPGNIPIRSDFVFSGALILPLLVIEKKISKRVFLQLATFIPFLVYFFIHKMIFAGELKDFLFIFITLYCICTYTFLSLILKYLDIKYIYKVISAFLIINFVLIFIQGFNLFSLNTVLAPYYKFLATNNVNSIEELDILNTRPFGTIGNCTKLAIITYLIMNLLSFIKPSKIKFLLGSIILLFTGARIVLAFYVFYETAIRFVNEKLNLKLLLKLFLVLISIFLFIGISYVCFPFIKYVLDSIIHGSFFDSYSFVYRGIMYKMLFSQSIKTWLIGGVSYSDFPEFVDAEYVMRIMQFGLIGLLLLYLPYIYFWLVNKNNKHSFFLLIFLLWCSWANFTVTNFMILPFILIFMSVIEKNKYEKT